MIKTSVANTIHIAGRGSVVHQLRIDLDRFPFWSILVSQFRNPSRQLASNRCTNAERLLLNDMLT